MPYRLAAAIIAAATAAHAEQITIDADDGVRFIRCTDMFGHAACEYVAEGSGMMRCIALDPDGEPIASAMAFVDQSAVTFADLDASRVARLACTRM